MEYVAKMGDYYVSAPSRRKYKKYDVYDKNQKYLLSFGDTRYEQYNDQFKYYKHLNHNDEERRRLYRLRHMNENISDPTYANYWSYNFLW